MFYGKTRYHLCFFSNLLRKVVRFNENNMRWYRSEAFSVDDWCSGFLIFCFSDPHGLEGWKRAENWSTYPDQEFSFSWSHDFDFHGWGGQSGHLFAETFRDTREHSCSTAHHDVAIKIFADINIALKNGLIGNFVESRHFFTNDHGFEEGFRTSESLVCDCYGLSVRELVGFVILSWVIVS